MNYKSYLIKLFPTYTRTKIIFTDHTYIRLAQREITPEDVVENIINPIRLEYAIKQHAKHKDEEKYECYFGYSKYLCHRYVIVIENNLIVVTAIKITRQWKTLALQKVQKR